MNATVLLIEALFQGDHLLYNGVLACRAVEKIKTPGVDLTVVEQIHQDIDITRNPPGNIQHVKSKDFGSLVCCR